MTPDQFAFIASGKAEASGTEFMGRIGQRTFSVKLLSPRANSFHPRMHGELKASSSGADTDASLGFPLPVRVFVAVVSVFLVLFGVFSLFEGYAVPGIAALVFFGMVWAIVGYGVTLARHEDARLLERFTALLSADAQSA
jgi:hypothetical protein